MQLADFGLKTCNVLPDRADSVGVSMRASDLCGSYSSGAKKLNYAAAGGALNWLTAWLAYTHTHTVWLWGTHTCWAWLSDLSAIVSAHAVSERPLQGICKREQSTSPLCSLTPPFPASFCHACGRPTAPCLAVLRHCLSVTIDKCQPSLVSPGVCLPVCLLPLRPFRSPSFCMLTRFLRLLNNSTQHPLA